MQQSTRSEIIAFRKVYRNQFKGNLSQATGQEIHLKPRHELMFIKMEYWGLIFAAIGLVLLFTQR
jgi:hypothetical protein